MKCVDRWLGKKYYNREIKMQKQAISLSLSLLNVVIENTKDMDVLEEAVEAFAKMKIVPFFCRKSTARQIVLDNEESIQSINEIGDYFIKRGEEMENAKNRTNNRG